MLTGKEAVERTRLDSASKIPNGKENCGNEKESTKGHIARNAEPMTVNTKGENTEETMNGPKNKEKDLKSITRPIKKSGWSITGNTLNGLKTIELRNCPFCGSTAEIRYSIRTEKYYVICTNPACRCKTGHDLKEKVAGKWNRRIKDAEGRRHD